jgi:hypothetical protein
MKNLAIDIKSTFFGTGGGAKLQDLTGIAALVSFFVKSVLVVAGIVLLFMFLLGGFGMIAGAGKGDPKQLEQARQTMTSAILGFVIVFLSYWIVKLILGIFGLPNII